jgi:uncharacterized protein (DUF305 family)
MTSRHRAGIRLAAAEARAGSVPELRQLAQQLLADQQDQIGKLKDALTPGGGEEATDRRTPS